MKRVIITTILVTLSAMLSGCDTLSYQYNQAQRSIAESSDSGKPVKVTSEARLVSATGYAPIAAQPGATQGQKVLNAMRASKLRAYQELAAIVHGQYLFGTTQVREMVLQSDQFDSAVGGIIRGARVVKSYPIQNDTYATILELDLRDVQRAYVDMQ